MFKIEDVARECGLTKRTIRYYEEIGILPPPERSEGGVRIYTQEHIDMLKKIINTRDVLGFSLQELQRYISISDELNQRRQSYNASADPEERRARLTELDSILSNQLQMLDEKLVKISQVRKELDALKERVRQGLERLERESGTE
ncbi:MerR family transcriptional regulator [Paenibacillus sp. P26]|nr:MerR family transcriptional regulator [Paenibacillus sp. P26]UUZ92064.1 MerR family transcriptional regulator [Paenibacillus sp. P25]